jgi:hypothetical protein
VLIDLDVDKKQIMRALIAFSVEKVLLDIGKPVLDKVAAKLYKEYQCYIPDCYEHPDYLNSVLRSIFGNSYVTIAQSIKLELNEHLEDKAVLRLINTIVS